MAVLAPTDAPTLRQVTAHLRDRLARYKQPKQVVNLDALPRNSMGKVQKNLLRQRFSDLFA